MVVFREVIVAGLNGNVYLLGHRALFNGIR